VNKQEQGEKKKKSTQAPRQRTTKRSETNKEIATKTERKRNVSVFFLDYPSIESSS